MGLVWVLVLFYQFGWFFLSSLSSIWVLVKFWIGIMFLVWALVWSWFWYGHGFYLSSVYFFIWCWPWSGIFLNHNLCHGLGPAWVLVMVLVWQNCFQRFFQGRWNGVIIIGRVLFLSPIQNGPKAPNNNLQIALCRSYSIHHYFEEKVEEFCGRIVLVISLELLTANQDRGWTRRLWTWF